MNKIRLHLLNSQRLAFIWRSMKTNALLILFMVFSSSAFAGSPDCGGPNGYAVNEAAVYLINAGLIDRSVMANSKARKTILLASQKIGKDLYRQVYRVIYTEPSGKKVEVITVNNASNEECSVSGFEAFLVSRHFGSSRYLTSPPFK